MKKKLIAFIVIIVSVILESCSSGCQNPSHQGGTRKLVNYDTFSPSTYKKVLDPNALKIYGSWYTWSKNKWKEKFISKLVKGLRSDDTIAYELEYKDNGALHKTNIYEYDKADNNTLIAYFNNKDKLTDWSLIQYGEHEEKVLEIYQSGSSEVSRTEYLYDANGLMEKAINHRFYKLNAIQYYHYNKKQQLVKKLTEDPSYKKEWTTTYTYGSDGKINEELVKTKNTMNEPEEIRTLFSYDEKGNVTEKKVTTYLDDKPVITTYTYDKNDNLIEENWCHRECCDKALEKTDATSVSGMDSISRSDSLPASTAIVNVNRTSMVDINRTRKVFKHDASGNVIEERKYETRFCEPLEPVYKKTWKY